MYVFLSWLSWLLINRNKLIFKVEKEEAAAKEALPAASTVKPVIGVEDYTLANTAADWNEGTVAVAAPQNWAEDGTAVAPVAAAPVAPTAALDWTVCTFYLYLSISKCSVNIYFCLDSLSQCMLSNT